MMEGCSSLTKTASLKKKKKMASFQTVCLTIDPGVHQQLIPVQRSWLLAVCPVFTWLFVLVLLGC